MTYQRAELALNSHTQHYLQWGREDAQPILCLHGYLDIAQTWLALAESLQDDFRIIAPDFRGHGESGWCSEYNYFMFHYVNDLHCLIEHLGWERFHLVGHSMGANCASLFAGTFPQMVQSLIMIEGFGVPLVSADDAPERLAQHIRQRSAKTSQRSFDSFEQVVARLRNINGYSEELALRMAKGAAKQRADGRWVWKFDPQVRFANPLMYLQEQFHAFWKRITAPTLQVLGEESPFQAMMEQEHWKDISNNQVVTIPNARHAVHHDASEQLNSIVRKFLKEKSS